MADPTPKAPPSAPKRRPFPRHIGGSATTAHAAQARAPTPSKTEHDGDPSSSGGEGKGDKVARTSGFARETPRTTYGISFDAQCRMTEGTFTMEEDRRSKLSSVAGERGVDGILDMEHTDEAVLGPALADIPEQVVAAGAIGILDEVARPARSFPGQADIGMLQQSSNDARRVPSRVSPVPAQHLDEDCASFEEDRATFPRDLGADPDGRGLPAGSQDVLVDVLAAIMTPRGTMAATRRVNGAAGSSADMVVVDDGGEGDEDDVEVLDMLDIQLTDDMLLRQEAAPESRGPARALEVNSSHWASVNPDLPATESAPVPALDPVLAPPVAQEMLDLDSGLSDEDEDEMMDRIAPLLRAGRACGLPATSSTDTFEDWCFEFTSARSVAPREADRASIHRWPSAGASQAKIEQKKAAQAATAAQAAEALAAVAALPGPQTDLPEPDGTSNPTLGYARQKFGNLPFRNRNRERPRRDQRLPRTDLQLSSTTPTTVATLSALSSVWTGSRSPDLEALEVASAASMPLLHGPISHASGGTTASADACQSFAADATQRVAEANVARSTANLSPPPSNETPACVVATHALTEGTHTLSPMIQSATVNGHVLNGDVARSLRRARTTGASSSASC